MDLQIKNQDEIELPIWIGDSTLTLAEIGAVAVLACLQKGVNNPKRINSAEMQQAMHSLREKGVFNASSKTVAGRVQIKLTVDLDVVAPPET